MRLYMFLFVLASCFNLYLGLNIGTIASDCRRSLSGCQGSPQPGQKSIGSPIHVDDKASIINIPRTRSINTRKRSITLPLYRARRYSEIVPIQYAASSLWLFYSALERQANGPWSTHPMQQELWVKLGNLRIRFVSLNGIPWSFVASFAAKMINATLLGYTGTYDMTYFDPDNPDHGGIVVWLRVIDRLTGNDLPVFED